MFWDERSSGIYKKRPKWIITDVLYVHVKSKSNLNIIEARAVIMWTQQAPETKKDLTVAWSLMDEAEDIT